MSCASQAKPNKKINKVKRLIVDTDVGTDDAVALLLLLRAESLGLVKIEMIVCSYGNAHLDDVVTNVVRILETAKRIDVPVYRGVAGPLIPNKTIDEFFHGRDGFGDLEYCHRTNTSMVREDSFIERAYELAKRNPGEISLICLAPLTNVALIFKVHPDFVDALRDLFVMGGNHKGWGNVTRSAEFNFYTDPEAADIVMISTRCPTYLLTWECCLNSQISMGWRFTSLAGRGGETWQLVHRAEASVYRNWKPDEKWTPCDAFLVAVFLHPDEMISKKMLHHVRVELAGGLTRGQAVFDHRNEKPKCVWVVKKINDDFFTTLMNDAADSI